MLAERPQKKILVAVRQKDVKAVAEALGTDIGIVFCHTLEEARAALDSNTCLVVCGVHFDSGRMFDFLRFVKQDPATQSIPFFIVLGGTGRYSKPILRGIESAAKLLGAQQLLNLPALIEKVGKEEAYRQIRQGVRQFLSG